TKARFGQETLTIDQYGIGQLAASGDTRLETAIWRPQHKTASLTRSRARAGAASPDQHQQNAYGGSSQPCCCGDSIHATLVLGSPKFVESVLGSTDATRNHGIL